MNLIGNKMRKNTGKKMGREKKFEAPGASNLKKIRGSAAEQGVRKVEELGYLGQKKKIGFPQPQERYRHKEEEKENLKDCERYLDEN